MADATTEMILRVQADVQAAQRQLDGLGKKVDDLGVKGKKTTDGFSKGFSDLIPSKAMIAMGAASAAVAGLGAAVSELMAREDALADFSALTGITGAKLDEFGDAAVDLSNKFGTGVIENIEAFKGVLSRLGPDFASSSSALKSMGDSINTLSKASGLDATASMDALTTAMLQFGVDLSDPSEAAGIAADMMNVMAAAAKEGAAEIPQISEALKQVGNTADSLNISFEQTNAAIQLLAQGGKVGSEAGVALRNVLTSMTKGSKAADEALGEIGLSTAQLGKVMTEEGLDEALKLFNNQLQTVPSLSEQAAIKVAVFGKENLAAAGQLLKTADGMDALQDKITGTGTAYDQAAVKMSTASERMGRVANEAWNTLLSGLQKFGSDMMKRIDDFIGSIDRLGSAFADLITLDVSGFWDKLTMSTQEYNIQKEKQLQLEEQNYRLLLQQENKREKETAQRKELLDLQNELVGKLKEVEKITDSKKLVGHMDKFKELFNKGQVKSVDEYFLAIKTQSEAAAADAKTKTDAAKKQADAEAEAFRKRVAGVKLNADAIGAESEAVTALRGQWQAFHEWASGRESPLNKMLASMQIETVDTGEASAKFHRSLQQDFEKSQRIADATGTAFSAAFESIGRAAAGEQDAIKNGLRAILLSILDFINAEYVAAGAAAAIRALISGGLSLFADSAGFVAASAALTAARGVISSFRTGIDYVPRDQMPAYLHRGEAVLREDEAERYRQGKAPKGSGRKDSPVRVQFVAFESAIQDSNVRRSRRMA